MHLSFKMDNTTAVALINHMGTSHSKQLNALNSEIWDWCVARNLWISVGHIAGKCNVKADQESRQTHTATEWMLQKKLLAHALDQLQFTPGIDLFATHINCQFHQYVAYRPDAEAVAIDAFSIPWTGLKLYAFPPFSVIPSLLKKIQEDQAERVCLLPSWPTQPWFPKAMQIATRSPVKLKVCKTLLSLPNQPQ